MKRFERIAAIDPLHADWFGRPLIWGQTDCAQLVAATCRAYGLDDPSKGVKPYDTEAKAFNRLLKMGYDNLHELLCSIGTEQPLAMAWPGDVLGFASNDERWGVSLGLMISDTRALALHPFTGLWDHCAPEFAITSWRLV